MEPKRKYRGALLVVELQDEVMRLHRAVPAAVGDTFGDITQRRLSDAHFDAREAFLVALRALWRASPTRARAIASKLGEEPVDIGPVHLASWDKFRFRRRYGQNAPCGLKLDHCPFMHHTHCARPAGHTGRCSYDRHA